MQNETELKFNFCPESPQLKQQYTANFKYYGFTIGDFKLGSSSVQERLLFTDVLSFKTERLDAGELLNYF